MSEEFLKRFQEMKQHLLTLHRSPSQFKILLHLLGVGRSLRANELMNDLKMTKKATERALEKLYNKGLVQRSSFRRGSYYCNLRHLMLCILLTSSDLYALYFKQRRA